MLTREIKNVTSHFVNENLHIIDVNQIQHLLKILQERNEKIPMKKQGSKEIKMKKRSQIYKSDLFIDEDGLIRAGGRLNKSNLSN